MVNIGMSIKIYHFSLRRLLPRTQGETQAYASPDRIHVITCRAIVKPECRCGTGRRAPIGPRKNRLDAPIEPVSVHRGGLCRCAGDTARLQKGMSSSSSMGAGGGVCCGRDCWKPPCGA